MKFAKIAAILAICLTASCTRISNFQSPDTAPLANAASMPLDLTYGWHPGMEEGATDASAIYGSLHKGRGKLAAVLPLTGKFAAAGTGMQRAMEIAALKSRDFITIEFFDIGGGNKSSVINDALHSGADIIIGPLFAEDVAELKTKNIKNIPVIAFTSDSDVLSGGVYSLGVAPKQQAEKIVKYAAAVGKRHMLILAPDTKVGRILAANSRAAAEMYGIEIIGLYYHDENARPDILREFAKKKAFHKDRSDANNEAKTVLAEVLAERGLRADEKADLEEQLKARNAGDAIGRLPYDSVLILSNANDAKSIASFLRYYDVSSAEVQFFGTAAWDADGVRSDMILSGAAFPGLPMNSPDFITAYRAVDGRDPARAVGAGYDAVMIATQILRSDIPAKIALTDTDGWKGADGIVRFRNNGESERGMMIYRLNGTNRMSVADLAPDNFMRPLYKLGAIPISLGNRIDLPAIEIDPLDYINIPDRFMKARRKNKNQNDVQAWTGGQKVFYMDDAPSETFTEDDFKFDSPEKIEQKLLQDVQIVERPKPAAKPAAKPAQKKPAAKPAPKPAAKPVVKPVSAPPAPSDYMDVEPM